MEYWAAKNASGNIEPLDIEGQEWLARRKIGAPFLVSAKEPRNAAFHRKYFAFIKYVYESTEKYENQSEVLTEMKLRTGHYETHISLKGVAVYVPSSIAFHKMGNDDFEVFYQKCIDVAIKYFYNDCTEAEQEVHIDNILSFA